MRSGFVKGIFADFLALKLFPEHPVGHRVQGLAGSQDGTVGRDDLRHSLPVNCLPTRLAA